MERSTSLPAWSPWDTSGHLPREQKPVLQMAYSLPPRLGSPAPLEEAFPFHLTVASLMGGQQWSSHLGLYLHSEMAGATGHRGETQGGELCDERSRRHFTLAEALQPGVHGVHAHSQHEPWHTGHCYSV